MQRFLKRILLLAVMIAFSASPNLSLNAQVDSASPKPLATGVLNVIEPELDARDSFTIPLPLPGLNATEYKPNFIPMQYTLYGQTRKIVFFRDVWQYEFGFLGLRQIQVDGKNVWYMVYRIRNTGKTLTYEQVKEDPRFDHIKNQGLRNKGDVKVAQFLPRFSLEGWASEPNGQYRRVVYRDQVSPDLVKLIQHREDPNRHLLNTYEMSQTKIPVSTDPTDPGVWGVAIWKDVDPTIDYVSVFVSGLTNAYRISSKNGKIGFKYRTLQLNFWRPGDTAEEIKDRIDYGIPLVDDSQEQVEICRRYHLPGPVLRAYRVDKNADQNILVLEADAEISLTTFKSPFAPQLDSGTLPPALAKAFADSGISLPNDVAIATLVNGIKWRFKDAEGTDFILKIEPQYWEPTVDNSIRFIKSLDHMWIYR